MDRIVELAVLRLSPDGTRTANTLRINPEIPIPPDATAIHGIHDEDVADCPTFAERAEEILGLFDACDLCGYNVLRFDVPMLTEEFLRVGINFEMKGRRTIDPQRIFHRNEPRDLSAALVFYCGEQHLNAHGAAADVDATVRVLEAQFERYPDLPRDVADLDRYCEPRSRDWVDLTGKLKWSQGEVAINFGKKRGVPLRTILDEEPGYAKWILRSDFPTDTREIVANALEGTWPTPPTGAVAPTA